MEPVTVSLPPIVALPERKRFLHRRGVLFCPKSNELSVFGIRLVVNCPLVAIVFPGPEPNTTLLLPVRVPVDVSALFTVVVPDAPAILRVVALVKRLNVLDVVLSAIPFTVTMPPPLLGDRVMQPVALPPMVSC